MGNLCIYKKRYMEKRAKIYIAGHTGLAWSAITKQLQDQGYTNLICKTHKELDLLDYQQVKAFFEKEKPEYVFLAAAKVGGLGAVIAHPAEFIYQNLQIQNNIIHLSYLFWVKKLLFLWSSCNYPKLCPQPIKEEYLLTSEFEKTNEPYSIAKIAGIKMCQSYNRQYGTNFIACMPTNIYGPGDNFNLETSHVLPWIIRKFYEAKINNKSEVILWWDWTPYREFLYVDDMADACIFLMNTFNPDKEQNEKWNIYINIGTGNDITIKELVVMVKNIVWYEWKLVWDSNKPNGTAKKLLDISKLKDLGWTYKTELKTGIEKFYQYFLEQYT